MFAIDVAEWGLDDLVQESRTNCPKIEADICEENKKEQ